MTGPQFIKIDRADYEHVARALVIYDQTTRFGKKRRSAGGEVFDLKERWLEDASRYGLEVGEQGIGKLEREALDALDEFIESEAWHELAWWIAERECARLGAEKSDRESRELVTDRIYHEVMAEFEKHGIDRLKLPGVPADPLPPHRVAETLRLLRSETKEIGSD